MAEPDVAAQGPAPDLVRMQAPADCGGFSFDGVGYPVSKKGVMRVPTEAVAAALSHGFTTIDPVEPAESVSE